MHGCLLITAVLNMGNAPSFSVLWIWCFVHSSQWHVPVFIPKMHSVNEKGERMLNLAVVGTAIGGC